MHYRMFALLPKDEVETSQEARENVQSELENDTSFVGEGGRFNSPVADWFVIGGRWSGALTQAILDKEKLKKFFKEFQEKKLGWINRDNPEEKQREKSHKLFRKYFPDFKGEIPLYRDSYNHIGYDDDAVLVDKEIYKTHLKRLEKTYDWGKAKEGEWHVELICLYDDYPAKLTAKNIIGKYWIVVVDYHS